jgi:signal transduction histidine kinase
MKLSLSTKWFLWLAVVIAVFCLGQVLGMLVVEILEVRSGEETLAAEANEILMLVGVSFGVFLLMLGGIWFISIRMLRPIRSIAESARRISEGELEERMESGPVEDENGMLVSALNSAFDRYHEGMQNLDRFAGNAAHQLRTPLASMRSLGEVCLQKERSAEEYRESIGSMLEVVRELSLIVERLLLLARMNRSRVRQGFSEVFLDELVSEIVDLHRPMIDEKEIELIEHSSGPVVLTGDGSLIREAVKNVLDNAVRFTPRQGTIEVALREDDRTISLEVRDSGPGLCENLRDALTEGAGDSSTTTELPGGRLGLAIVSQIMRVHDGALEFPTDQKDGAVVVLSWPRLEVTG